MNTFHSIGLEAHLLQAINDLGFESPSEVQSKAIPLLLTQETDLVVLAQTGRLTAEFSFSARRDPVQMTPNRRNIGPIYRQHVLQQIHRHAIGHQRRPFGLEIQELRRGMLGEKSGQRAERPAFPRLTGASIKPRTGQRHRPEQGPEGHRIRALSPKSALTMRAMTVLAQIAGDLGFDDRPLKAGQNGLPFF